MFDACCDCHYEKTWNMGLTETNASKFPRASGILLHPTSLPGRFGIGDLLSIE